VPLGAHSFQGQASRFIGKHFIPSHFILFHKRGQKWAANARRHTNQAKTNNGRETTMCSVQCVAPRKMEACGRHIASTITPYSRSKNDLHMRRRGSWLIDWLSSHSIKCNLTLVESLATPTPALSIATACSSPTKSGSKLQTLVRKCEFAVVQTLNT